MYLSAFHQLRWVPLTCHDMTFGQDPLNQERVTQGFEGSRPQLLKELQEHSAGGPVAEGVEKSLIGGETREEAFLITQIMNKATASPKHSTSLNSANTSCNDKSSGFYLTCFLNGLKLPSQKTGKVFLFPTEAERWQGVHFPWC